MLVPTGHPGTAISWLQGSPCMVIRASQVALVVKNMPANAGRCKRHQFDSWARKSYWRRNRLPASVFLSFTCGSAGEESVCNVRDLGLIPGLLRTPLEKKGYPLWYSGLENSMFYTVHGITTSQTQLSDFRSQNLETSCFPSSQKPLLGELRYIMRSGLPW